MTIILELTPLEEADLKHKAAMRGLDVKAFLLQAANAQTQSDVDHLDIARFEALLDQAARSGPALPDEALTSEGIYRDHD